MSENGQPTRVGFLGAGYIAEWHAKALKTVSGVVLTAVCDKDPSRARGFAQAHGLSRWYESLDAMLEDERLGLEAVHVLLPPDLHAGAATALIEKGLHILLEKPMAATVSECQGLIEQAKARGVTVGVNHNFLFAPVYESLRQDLKSGKIGRPDHLLVTWNRTLDQLQSGPSNLWMLREPRNIIVEIGPHCLAPVLDLLGSFQVSSVNASNPVALQDGQEFFRRWSIEGQSGATAVTLHLSFSTGFTEQSIHVRGSLASATVDFERNTYLLHTHTRYGPDFDRYQMIRQEAKSLAVQARHSLSQYALTKLKLSSEGNPYGLSIARSVRSFYGNLGKTADSRISAEMGRDIVALCAKIGERGGSAAAPTKAVWAQRVSPGPSATSPADILILGATGFIGQELARQFVAGGHRIRLLVRNPARLPGDLQTPEIDVVRGDLTRAEDREKAIAGTRVVYHLARANVRTWEEFTEQDIEVTRQVAEACLASRVHRLIYTGTIDSYYAGAKAGAITEATPLDPYIAWRNLYARAKAASEQLLMESHRERGLPVVIFRPGIVIGRGGSPFHWGVGMWSWNAVCQIWGSGTNPLPLVLVEDVAQALLSALDVPSIEGESFNLVADTDISALDYLKALEETAGVSFQKLRTPPWRFYAGDLLKWTVKKMIRHPDQRRPSYRDWESRTQRAHYDCTKARKLLNWKPVSDRNELIRRGIRVPCAEFLA